jgi:hypothetical protein
MVYSGINGRIIAIKRHCDLHSGINGSNRSLKKSQHKLSGAAKRRNRQEQKNDID